MSQFPKAMHIDTYLIQTAAFASLSISLFKFQANLEIKSICPSGYLGKTVLFSPLVQNLKMVKLASAREIRLYGPRLARNRWEYINAGLYVFAAILMLFGYMSLLSMGAKWGLVAQLIALALIILVNLQDLFAHLAAIDYRLSLIGLDRQLGLVEFAVPVVQALGSILIFLGILFLFIQVLNLLMASSEVPLFMSKNLRI